MAANEENTESSTSTTPGLDPSRLKRKAGALSRPARKKPVQKQDPYEYGGRHFGRAVHAFANVAVLITNGLGTTRDIAMGVTELRLLDTDTRREYEVYQILLKMFPDMRKGVEEGTLPISELLSLGNSVQRGAAASRADDVKNIKSVIVEWIAHPTEGLKPPIPRNSMLGRGWNHEATGKLLVPAGLVWEDVKSHLRDGTMIVKGDQWPIFLYEKSVYDPDDPWKGLLRGELVEKAFKYIFTSPSSVNEVTKATRSGNARLHGMEKTTAASLVYIATIVRFSLSSANCFIRSDVVTDSENFYTTLFNFITDPEEKDNLTVLLDWWDKQVFRSHSKTTVAPSQNSALAKLLEHREKRRRALAPAGSTINTPSTSSR